MRKFLISAAFLFVAALFCALPSRADSVTFTLSGGAIGASFSLPQTFTPSSSSGPIFFVNSVLGTLFGDTSYLYGTVDIGNSNPMCGSSSSCWSFGSTGSTGHPGPEIGIFAPGLFTVNSDGTITLHDVSVSFGNISGAFITLTTTGAATTGGDKPNVGTPEPASLLLLGFGSLSLLGLRRRKAA
jgi:hypothetical protein